MPLPGEQHRPTTAAAGNPFERQVPRISEYTAKELATLQSRLDKQLGPEYISSRPGAGGGKVHYIAAEKVINLANEVFGFNGWSSQIQSVQIDFVDENPNTGKISLGLSTIVRVTLKDGTFHEDLGYGQIENCKGKAPAFEKAKKEAVTDALKRALRNFGNVLGNCLYDKEYLGKITKVKSGPSKWDESNLHRHPDFVTPKTQNSAESGGDQDHHAPSNGVSVADYNDIDDEFGINILDEVEIDGVNPDEVTVPAQNRLQPPQIPTAVQPQVNGHAIQPTNGPNKAIVGPNQSLASPQNNLPTEPPVGFITSRAAEALTGQNVPPTNIANLPRFNPTADSPSIRKTNGVNHATSAPVTKSFIHGGAPAGDHPSSPTNQPSVPATVGAGSKAATANFGPSEHLQRQIGAPPNRTTSPHSNRSMYKPPTVVAGVKRVLTPTAAPEVDPSARPPLADVSNGTTNAAGPVPSGDAKAASSDALGDEAKRVKVTDA